MAGKKTKIASINMEKYAVKDIVKSPSNIYQLQEQDKINPTLFSNSICGALGDLVPSA